MIHKISLKKLNVFVSIISWNKRIFVNEDTLCFKLLTRCQDTGPQNGAFKIYCWMITEISAKKFTFFLENMHVVARSKKNKKKNVDLVFVPVHCTSAKLNLGQYDHMNERQMTKIFEIFFQTAIFQLQKVYIKNENCLKKNTFRLY